jgi:ATP-binding cassette subfamily F protein 3
MLTLSEISKAYGGRVLFDDVTLQLNREDRIGLVGPNGAGKSTLFSIILGEEEADSGQVMKERNVVFGYLPQESAPVGDETVLELATAISPEFVKLRRLILSWDSDHHIAPDHVEEIHDDAHNRFHELGGYQLDAKAKQILSGLGFREKDFDRKARELSGGWVMRAHLARLLVQEPDLLLLDEPTNHLDLEALIWFQEYLTTYPGAIVVISHDREFLNHIVSGIVEIRSSKLNRYRGNYDDFLVQRAAAEEQLLAAYKNQQKEIERLQEFADRFRAKASKASQAQSKLKQIERMEKIEAPVNDTSKIGFSFPQPQRSGQKVITLENIHFAYGENVVYRGMEFSGGTRPAHRARRAERRGQIHVAENSCRRAGAAIRHAHARPQRQGRLLFAVSRRDAAGIALGVRGGVDTPARVTEQFIRTLLGSFLFRGDDVFKKISVLSGGEKSRLALVKLLLDPPNLLLMDEPTTHLDMASIDALVGALKQFQGTLVFISHDVYFIRALSGHVVHVNAGQLTHYPGGYQYYLDKTKATSARAALTSGGKRRKANQFKSESIRRRKFRTVVKVDRKEQKRLEAQQRQSRSGEKKAQQQLVHKLEKEIQELEAKQAELTAELENPETYNKPGRAQEINRELAHVQQRLAQATPEWEAAESKLAITQ